MNPSCFAAKSFPTAIIVQFSAVLLAVVCCSCATNRYSEPAVPPNQCAVLLATPPVWVNSIDGRRTHKGFGNKTREFRVLPGEHVVELGFGGVARSMVKVGEDYQSREVVHSYRSRGTIPLVISMQAGKAYPIQYKLFDGGQRVRYFVPEFKEPAELARPKF